MEFIILGLLGTFLFGIIIFGVLIQFSLNDLAKSDILIRVRIYFIPYIYRRKYYKLERLWVRNGMIICSIGLFLTLIVAAALYINPTELGLIKRG